MVILKVNMITSVVICTSKKVVQIVFMKIGLHSCTLETKMQNDYKVKLNIYVISWEWYAIKIICKYAMKGLKCVFN